MNLTARIRPLLIPLAFAFLAMVSQSAVAADDASQDDLQEVVITGSYLLTPQEAAALPIRVVTAEDLLKQGSPTLVELFRAMPEAAGRFRAH